MKKVLASLLVLVSFASFGGVVSFADNTFNESNYWKHAVNTILYPKDLKCANFDVCLKMKTDETRRLTNGKFDFDISPFLG